MAGGNCPEYSQDAIGDEVVSEIIAATERGPTNQDYGVGGHEAFTSIVFSPKVRNMIRIYDSSFCFSSSLVC